MDTLKLFYRDIDLFLNNLFLGGFTTMDNHAVAEIEELIRSSEDLGLSFLQENLNELREDLLQINSGGSDQSRLSETVRHFTLLVEYINISKHELSLQEISEEMR